MTTIPLVAYYTPDYEHFAQRMVRQVKQPMHILPVASLGSWLANLTLKPKIIKETLKNVSEFAYVDIDSIFRKPVPIEPLPADCDIGLVPYNCTPRPLPYGAGFIQVRRTINTERWLEAWIQLCEQQWKTGATDHPAMIYTLTMVKVHPLPTAWMYVHGAQDPLSMRDVCIEYGKAEDQRKPKGKAR